MNKTSSAAQTASTLVVISLILIVLAFLVGPVVFPGLVVTFGDVLTALAGIGRHIVSGLASFVTWVL